MKNIFEYIRNWKEKEQLNELISQINDCCVFRVNNYRNKSLTSWLRTMKMFGYSNEAISVAMVIINIERKDEL